jgi:flavin-dependent dehydrogenase
MKYDVVVVGGRVAGSTSSLFASKSGLDVLMIEKRQEIGTPVQCGEATTKDTFKTLEMKPSKKYLRTEIKGVYGRELGFCYRSLKFLDFNRIYLKIEPKLGKDEKRV